MSVRGFFLAEYMQPVVKHHAYWWITGLLTGFFVSALVLR